MSVENFLSGSGTPGSPVNGPSNSGAGGQPKEIPTFDASKYVEKAVYEEAVGKLGSQGQELGDLRNFVKDLEPLLTKLDEQPELIQSILSGKVDSKLAKAVEEGKIKLEDAALATEAQKQVEGNLGSKKFNDMDPDKLQQLIEEKAREIASKTVKEETSKFVDEQNFEKQAEAFISNTPDFEKYAESITEWLDSHPDQDSIEVAYYAVKGKALEEALRNNDQATIAEAAKALALNLTGGSQRAGALPSSEEYLDSIISPRRNPNSL